MQADTVQKRLESLASLSLAGKRVNGLSRILPTRIMMDNSVNRTRGNHGSATPGIDGETLDGLTIERINGWVHRMTEGSYRAQPVKRVYIPKANGKLRPLGIPTFADRMIQNGQREILQRIYEPVFSDWSYGFRPGRSCHTALTTIQRRWAATKWFIEVDIKGYFDNIDHDVLLNLLRKRIDDEAFIATIRAQLQAGVMVTLSQKRKGDRKRMQFRSTYSGTPQGGLVSPILANIYLHELDMFMEAEMSAFDRGTKRQRNPAYAGNRRLMVKLRKKIRLLDKDGRANTPERGNLITELQALARENRTIPSVDPMDPNYRRLHYVRYADDFLIGVIGSKAEAAEMLLKVRRFLKDTLHLDVSEEKTRVVKAADGARFLGYDIRTKTGAKLAKYVVSGITATKRSSGERIILVAPESKLEAFCVRHRYGSYQDVRGKHRTELINSSDYEIVSIYNAELRGLANYYRLDVYVRTHMSRLAWVVRQSLTRTLAAKHKTSVAHIVRRLRRKDGRLVARHAREGKESLEVVVWKLMDLRDIGKASTSADMDAVPLGALQAFTRNDVTIRLQGEECENVLCKSPPGTPIEVHHVNALANVSQSDWIEWIKSARSRKTRYLCAECHPLTKTRSKQRGVKYSKGEPGAMKVASPVRGEGALQPTDAVNPVGQG